MRLIRDAYEAVNEGRFDWGAANLPPHFELIPTAGMLSTRDRFVGPEGASEWFADVAEAWESIRTDVEEIIDLGNRVVVLGRLHNRARASGVEVDVVAAHLWTVEDGVPVRVELLGDRGEALRRGHAESRVGAS